MVPAELRVRPVKMLDLVLLHYHFDAQMDRVGLLVSIAQPVLLVLWASFCVLVAFVRKVAPCRPRVAPTMKCDVLMEVAEIMRDFALHVPHVPPQSQSYVLMGLVLLRSGHAHNPHFAITLFAPMGFVSVTPHNAPLWSHVPSLRL